MCDAAWHQHTELALQEAERIAKKAQLTHKEKVTVRRAAGGQHTPITAQAMNQYLEKLTEHYDIPKVSWTK